MIDKINKNDKIVIDALHGKTLCKKEMLKVTKLNATSLQFILQRLTYNKIIFRIKKNKIYHYYLSDSGNEILNTFKKINLQNEKEK